MSNHVKVCYQIKDEPGVYGMQAFTYQTDLPLRVGDVVIAPTRYGDRVARVHQTNVPDGEIDIRWELKTIEKYFAPETENLCDTCIYEFADCSGNPTFGAGKGLDNVLSCTKYEKGDR